MKLRARAEAIIFKRNRVLCALHTDPSYIVFPGGGIEPHESAIAAASRETFEESGRKLVHPSVAHPSTVQLWPKGYAERKGNKWADGYEGGFTYWMTGSAADLPVAPADRHKDFESNMDWQPVKEIIGKLKADLNGEWGDDTKVRLKILETHLDMQREHKEAEPVFVQSLFMPRLPFPTLSVRKY